MSCKNCKYSPKTYEEYCIGQSNPAVYCPDAYTERSQFCLMYEEDKEVLTNENDN